MTIGPQRWRDQRWLVDEAIRNQGIEFDQPRVGYSLGPVASDSTLGEMVALRTRIKKIADYVPTVSGMARRREAMAQKAEDAGYGSRPASTGSPRRCSGRWPAGRSGR